MNQHLISILVLFFSIIQKAVLPYSLVKTIRTYWAKIHSLWLMPLFKNMHYTVRFYKIGGLCGMQYISIDEKTIFQKGIYLTAYNVPSCITKPTLKIGKHCNFGAYNHITCANSIEIGDNVLTGKWVTISDNSHGATFFVMTLLAAMTAPSPIVTSANIATFSPIQTLSPILIFPLLIIGLSLGGIHIVDLSVAP